MVNSFSYQWPQEDIDFCGERIINEQCSPESRRPDKAGLFDVKICFSKKDGGKLNKYSIYFDELF